MSDTIKGYATITDDAGRIWVLIGPDPAGTPMAVYAPARAIEDKRSHSLLRALAIEDRYGIRGRGPLVTLDGAR